MKNRMKEYIKKIDNLLKSKNAKTDWTEVEKEHLIHIQFYQHERLIHFLVTMLVAILAMLSLILLFLEFQIGVLLLFFMFIILLVPYLSHYYFLENNVQKMYDQHDLIKEKQKNKKELS